MQVLTGSWAHRTLEAASIDMVYAPPLLAAQVYSVRDTHCVFRLLAHKWARCLHSPCRLGGPPMLQSGGENQKWPTSGPNGHNGLLSGGVTYASKQGTKSEVAHKWAQWLHKPCRLADPLCFRVGDKIRSGPQAAAVEGIPYASKQGTKSKVAHKWAQWLQDPCYRGVPYASKRGTKSEVAHKWAQWLHNPCYLGDPLCFRAGDKIRSGPQVGPVAA